MSWLARLLGREGRGEPAGDPARVAAVQRVIEGIAPLVAADGGAIELLAVEDGWVSVRLSGACAHCASSDMTLRDALEPRLRAALPWFRGLRAG